MKKTKTYFIAVIIIFLSIFSFLDTNVVLAQVIGNPRTPYQATQEVKEDSQEACEENLRVCVNQAGSFSSRMAYCNEQYNECNAKVEARDPILTQPASATPVNNTPVGQSSNSSAVSGCEAGFDSVGGVCFPTTTGLSEAPVIVIISNIFSWLMGLFTTLAVAAFVVSGIQYLTAAGNEDHVKTAKDNAKFALLGIIIGLSGFIVVRAIASALSGTSIFF